MQSLYTLRIMPFLYKRFSSLIINLFNKKDTLFQYIGNNYPSNSQYFAGNIDEVAGWNSDKSASVSTIYNSGTPNDLTSLSPVAWYRMGDSATFREPQILMPENTNIEKVSN